MLILITLWSGCYEVVTRGHSSSVESHKLGLLIFLL